jgi:hypothetical protein
MVKLVRAAKESHSITKKLSIILSFKFLGTGA